MYRGGGIMFIVNKKRQNCREVVTQSYRVLTDRQDSQLHFTIKDTPLICIRRL